MENLTKIFGKFDFGKFLTIIFGKFLTIIFGKYWTIIFGKYWTIIFGKYRVSHKKLYLVLEGCSTPKF